MVTFYRRLPKFDYVAPSSLSEALNLLQTGEPGQYKVYAGGTDVIPKLKARLIQTPQSLMDLKGIPHMDYIVHDEKKGLRIGALASIFDVAHSPVVLAQYPVLAQAARSIASVQIQNRGTIVGNLCNAVPSADSAPALLCLDAKVVCQSSLGERVMDLHAFFKGPNQTFLEPTEIVTEIQVPPMPNGSQGVYLKLSPRSKMDLAITGVAVVVFTDSGKFKDARIGLGAVAPTPIRSTQAENRLNGEIINDQVIGEAARLAADESRPLDDHRASAEYRRMMVEVLVKRAIKAMAQGSRRRTQGK
ncbi:MAG: xanthine dehydrogenase family protein subunit M [Deltaproteobacteria bacterium]|nr:xanthine dehydrogenase family protein subunit M [Deltaproteobacteria bacterium]